MNLKAESYENRGSTENPFGYVYFTDGTRVSYNSSGEIHGANWGPTSPKHHELARKMLVAEGIFSK